MMPQLLLAVLLTINGNVIKSDGAPVANVRITATRAGGGVLSRATTDANGAFKLEPVDGVVELETEAEGFLPARMTMLADEQPITLVLQPGIVVPDPTPESPKPRDGTAANVRGTVRDEANQPIAGAHVFVMDSSATRAITDAKGQFAFAIRREAKLMVSAGINATNPVVMLHPGETADIVVKRRPAIDGVLRDYDGTPVAGASVVFYPDDTSYMALGSAITDLAGRFRFYTETQRRGQLTARKVALPTAVSKLLEVSKKGLHDVALTIPRGIDVRGVVTDPDGHGVGGVAINPEEQAKWASTANDGSFNLRMNEGTAQLKFAKERYLATTVPVEVTSSMRPLAVKLQPIVYVRGMLVSKDGAPATHRVIFAAGMLRSEAQSGDDGTFELPFPAPGIYTIAAGLVSHETAVRAPADDVRIVFDEGLSVRGRVIDEAGGAPIKSAGITAYTESAEAAVVADRQDESGNFILAGLLPGLATIDVTAMGYLPAHVSVQAGQEQPVTIALKRGVTLRGHVRDSSGAPLEDVMIACGDGSVLSDAGGAFEFIGLPSEQVTVSTVRSGFINREITVAAKRLGEPLEIVLSSGLHVKGRAVAEGGVPATTTVVARSADLGAQTNVSVTTDANGQFEITGLSPARYDFEAGSEESMFHGSVRDVDVANVRELVIPVERRETGVIAGRVTGLSPEYVTRTVTTQSPEGLVHSAVGEDGTFHLEGVKTGKVPVGARVANAAGQQRSTSTEVDVPAGGEVHVELVFAPQRIVRGRVTRAGAPMPRVSVLFGGELYVGAITDNDGRYEARLEPTTHTVALLTDDGTDIPFDGEVDARQTSVYDIAIETSEVRVHVFDALTGEPVAAASVLKDGSDSLLDETGADGTVKLETASGKAVVLQIQKDGYGPAFVESAGGDVAVRLVHAVDVPVRVVDARDGRTLTADITAFDAQGHTVSKHQTPAQFELAPGDYRITASIDGFATETVRASVPSSGEVRIVLRRKSD